MELAESHPSANWWISKVHIQISELHMCVVPEPASQDAVFKRTYASPGLRCGGCKYVFGHSAGPFWPDKIWLECWGRGDSQT